MYGMYDGLLQQLLDMPATQPYAAAAQGTASGLDATAIAGRQLGQGMAAPAVSTAGQMQAMMAAKMHAYRAFQHAQSTAHTGRSAPTAPAASGLLLSSHQPPALPGTSWLQCPQAAPSAAAQGARAAALGVGQDMMPDSPDAFLELLASSPEDPCEDTMLGQERAGSDMEPPQPTRLLYPWQAEAASNSSSKAAAKMPVMRLPPHQQRAAALHSKTRQLDPKTICTSAAKRPKAAASEEQFVGGSSSSKPLLLWLQQQQHNVTGHPNLPMHSAAPTAAYGADMPYPTTYMQLPQPGPGNGTVAALGGAGVTAAAAAAAYDSQAYGFYSFLQQQAHAAQLSNQQGSGATYDASHANSRQPQFILPVDAQVPAAEDDSIHARIIQQCPVFEDILALTPTSLGPLQHSHAAGPFTESFARRLTAPAQHIAAAGINTVGPGQQQAAGVGVVAAHIEVLRDFFWSTHALLRLQAQQGLTLAVNGRPPSVQVNDFVNGMAQTAHMLSGIWDLLQTPTMAALSTPDDAGLMPSADNAAFPAPASAPAGVAQAPSQALQRVMRNFQQLLARNEALPIVPEGQLFTGQVILETTAGIQHLVQLCCSAVLQLIAMTKATDALHMQTLVIQPHGAALPQHVHVARVHEVIEMLNSPARHPEVHALLQTQLGLHELVSTLGPASVRKQLMKGGQAAIDDGTGLQGWFWLALELFLQAWGTPACCKEVKVHTAAGNALEKCVHGRVRFACLLVAACNLLCVDQPPWLL
jgi:hypothetical protein